MGDGDLGRGVDGITSSGELRLASRKAAKQKNTPESRRAPTKKKTPQSSCSSHSLCWCRRPGLHVLRPHHPPLRDNRGCSTPATTTFIKRVHRTLPASGSLFLFSGYLTKETPTTGSATPASRTAAFEASVCLSPLTVVRSDLEPASFCESMTTVFLCIRARLGIEEGRYAGYACIRIENDPFRAGAIKSLPSWQRATSVFLGCDASAVS